MNNFNLSSIIKWMNLLIGIVYSFMVLETEKVSHLSICLINLLAFSTAIIVEKIKELENKIKP